MAAQAVEAGDVDHLLSSVAGGNTNWLAFVAHNVRALKPRGLYEAALLDAMIMTRTNNHHLFHAVPWLLAMADSDRLRAAGDALPGPGPFTVYRGVAGRTSARRVRGASWTGSLEVARWFAQRGSAWGLHDPAVYRATVDAADVLAYVHDRGRKEAEFLVRLPASVKLRRVE